MQLSRGSKPTVTIDVACAGAAVLVAALACSSCTPRSPSKPAVSGGAAVPGGRPFTDITDAAGVRHRHIKALLDHKLDNIMPWMASVGASAAAADYDNDGWIDVYVTNSNIDTPNALFRNDGNLTFTDVAARAGVANANAGGGSMDAVWGDYDNDGWNDLYVVKWGPNVLYRSNGDGTFTDVTEKSGTGDKGNGNAAIWLDYNDDGYLDLYVANYFRTVDLWHIADTRQMHEDFETARDGGANLLYRNNGDGTFADVSKELKVDDTGWTLDAGAADYDNDGDQDLAIANDFGQDRIYRLNADATFTDVTDAAIGWDTKKGMNIEFGDYNNDGWLDLYVSNIWTKEYVQEGNSLYRNNGDGTFTDVAFEADVYDGGWAWGARFWDLDNDGDLDIMVANGYISGDPQDEYFRKLALEVTRPGFDPMDARNWPTMGKSTFAGYEPKRAFRNDGNDVFKDVAAELGLDNPCDGRGLAIADFDNDGDLDVFLSCQGQDSALYRNDLGNKLNWVEVELTGKNCNRNAIGARVTVVCGKLSQIREVNGGNGDHSQCPYRQHFGIGTNAVIDRLEIRWPTGHVEKFTGVQPNRILKYVEDTPADVLAERKRFKEAQAEARKLEVERERKKAAEAVAGAGEKEEAIDWGKMAGFKREYLKFKAAVEKTPDDPQLRYDFGMLLDRQDRKSAALGELEHAIRLAPDRLLYSNTYRALVRKYGHLYFDRSIRFFEDLVRMHPGKIMPRLNKSLAYVDKMPYPKIGIVAQGKLSNKSIAELDEILKIDPQCWAAKFVLGMNHLHWPRKLGHAPRAIREFTELIAMQKAFPREKRREYFSLAFVGLGDSYVKNLDSGREENLRKAREAWEAGLREFPESADLKKRLELAGKSEDSVIGYVQGVRGLEDPVNTDLNQVWVE
jgi:enediyne biosynthesis protein E4